MPASAGLAESSQCNSTPVRRSHPVVGSRLSTSGFTGRFKCPTDRQRRECVRPRVRDRWRQLLILDGASCPFKDSAHVDVQSSNLPSRQEVRCSTFPVGSDCESPSSARSSLRFPRRASKAANWAFIFRSKFTKRASVRLSSQSAGLKSTAPMDASAAAHLPSSKRVLPILPNFGPIDTAL